MQPTLFDSTSADLQLNLLPKDGTVNYLPARFDEVQCAQLFDALHAGLQWQPDRLRMFGKLVTTSRLVAWVGDPECSYTYSGVRKIPQAWTPELLTSKSELESLAGSTFNSCLLNLYHHGGEGMSWHSDDEPELDRNAPIVSLSLGAARRFSLRHRQEKLSASLILENGSVLIMRAPTQQYWQHSLPKTTPALGPRISLTFRKIVAYK